VSGTPTTQRRACLLLLCASGSGQSPASSVRSKSSQTVSAWSTDINSPRGLPCELSGFALVWFSVDSYCSVSCCFVLHWS
jgi:hypothetical protein